MIIDLDTITLQAGACTYVRTRLAANMREAA